MNHTFSELIGDHRSLLVPVVDFAPASDILLPLDFTQANKDLTEEILQDTARFSSYIDGLLDRAGAKYGIGGYDEHRTVYSRSTVFDAGYPGEEPRRLHLGTDIWGAADTGVMAPLDGEVHSFAFNDRFGDYGATIILSHQLTGVSFFSLYGHLGLSSLKDLYPGKKVTRGEKFATFGIPAENGHWPPHLHFQLILDMGGRNGDYPGVCRYSEKEEWLANSPDPDLILQLNRYI